jgi:Sugar (and other) transporter
MDQGTRQCNHFLDSRSHVRIACAESSICISVADLVNSGAFIVDPLNHYLGRRGEIFLTACCLTATPIGSGFAQSWQQLFAARFVMGIGIGAKNATVPIYSAEMAPARIRGALVMFWQLWVVAGKLLLAHRENYNMLIVTRRYFPRLLCQRYCQRHWSNCVASTTRLRVHPVLHPPHWYILLPRIPSLAYEAQQAREGFPIHDAPTSSPHYCRKRLLLLVCYLRGGTQGV